MASGTTVTIRDPRTHTGWTSPHLSAAAPGAPAADDETLNRFAQALREAEDGRRAIAPLIAGNPGLTVADADRIQLFTLQRRLAAGARIAGRKVGLTSRAMQQMMGVDEPDFGVLLDDMFVEEGDAIPVADLVQPRVEAEIALVLARDLRGPGISSTAALQAVE